MNHVPRETVEAAAALVKAGKVRVNVAQVPQKLYIEVIAKGGGHTGRAIVRDLHTNVVLVEQDGELLLSVTARYLSSDGDYYTALYRVDPATNEVLEASVTDYIKKESGEVSKLHTTRYRWSYDEPYQAERNVMNEVLFSTDSTEDVCDLTYFYPAPGSEKGWDVGENGWSVSEIRVAHGTRILFLDSADLAL